MKPIFDRSLWQLVTSRDGRLDRPYIMELMVFLMMAGEFLTEIWQRDVKEWFVGVFVGAFVLRGAFSAYTNTRSQRLRHDDPQPEQRETP